jgi:hypothetical protein
VGVTVSDESANVASSGLNYEVIPQPASFDGAHEFGNIALGSTASHTFTFTNYSSVPLNDLEFDIVGLDQLPVSQYQLGTITCGQSLDPDESCTVQVTFSSNTAGSFSGWVHAIYEGGESTNGVHAWAGEAEVAFTETAYDFGERPLESVSSHVLTLENNSNITATDLQILAPHSSEHFDIVSSTCGTTLAANSACEVEIEFKPVVATSSFHQLTVNYGHARMAFSDLSGSAAAGPLTFIDSWEDMGRITLGNSSVITLTLANTAQSTVTGVNLSLSSNGGGQVSIENNTCPNSLTASETCTLDLRFSSATVGFADALLVVRGGSGEYGGVYVLAEGLEPEPTSTPEPTATPAPTATSTSTPTATPIATAVPQGTGGAD